MRKSNKLAMLGAGFAMAVAALGGATSPKMAYANKEVRVEQSSNNNKALAAKVNATHRVVKENVGGLDLVQHGEYGMSPKEYGLRFGNGKSRKGKTNYSRMAHNAKLKRR